jgi:hypothetical protein
MIDHTNDSDTFKNTAIKSIVKKININNHL